MEAGEVTLALMRALAILHRGCCVAWLVLGCALPVAAEESQPASAASPWQIEISGGLAESANVGGECGCPHIGWLTAADFYRTRSKGLVIEASGSYENLSAGFNSRTFALLAGLKQRGALGDGAVAFGQILAGMSRVGNNLAGYSPHLILQPGGGVDIRLTGPFVLRLQGDFQWIASAGILGEARAAFGVVVRP